MKKNNQIEEVDDSFFLQEKEHIPYLHNETYEQRLKKAENLNRCKFRDASEFKSKRWGEPIPRIAKYRDNWAFNNCKSDGKIALMKSSSFRLFVILFFFYYLFAILSPLIIFEYYQYALISLALATALSIYIYVYRKQFRYFQFDRHLGLALTPRSFFRRPFYIPPEDLDLFTRSGHAGGRGGGNIDVYKIRCRKIPKRLYLFTPGFYIDIIYLESRSYSNIWATILDFMNTDKPLDWGTLYEINISDYYKKNENVLNN
ncbi:hypothetical protein [Grimontia marina]|uniref:Transmembrane protein n=1 Tax=Grimontia marina TaxID=646534 RepID=A0A128FKY6_9GAMM|nr:hypothetical protein [Grimontia marina]CZF87115.1 hypothetical protein GMA8713_05161 [Grimontia marina]